MKNRSEKDEIPAVPQKEELILLCLYGKELYGLEIPKVIESASGGSRQMGIGTLYPTLATLECKGLIESRWGEEQPEDRGGARRRYYKLTEKGTAILDAIASFRSALMNWQSPEISQQSPSEEYLGNPPKVVIR